MNFKEQQMNSENINETKDKSVETKINDQSNEHEEKYKFGWNSYSEITNGRFAMIGLFAIILIEFLSHQSFLKWAGIL